MPARRKPSTLGNTLRLAFASALLFVSNVRAQEAPSSDLPVTNLFQLVELLNQNEKAIRDIRLEATVCAASDPSIGVVILKDATDVELVELGAGQPRLLPGEKILIQQENCLLRRRHMGVQISSAPVVDNTGGNTDIFSQGGLSLKAGRYPLTLEWFNELYDPYFQASRWPPHAPPLVISGSGFSYNVSNGVKQFKPGLQVEYYEGNWDRIPDFDLLKPVKSGVVTNIDMGFQSQDEFAGLRFRGFIEVPTNGYYSFDAFTNEGSLLHIGDPIVKAVVLGTEPAPQATPAIINQAISAPCDQNWVSVEGHVGSVRPVGKGLGLELRAGGNSLMVRIADVQGQDSTNLLNSFVRVTGVGGGEYNLSGELILGQLSVASARDLDILGQSPDALSSVTPLLNIRQVQTLPIQEAAKGLPVHVRGVVTSIGLRAYAYFTVQDNTRGIFVTYSNMPDLIPVPGDYYDIVGHSSAGDFAPIIVADKIVRLGRGELPEPSRPAWNAIVNGSMDVQWAEFQGLVTDVQSNMLSLLLPGGKIDVQIYASSIPRLDPFKKSVITIRGVLLAEWNGLREVRIGLVKMHNATITTDVPAPADPFDAVSKTPRELLLFDAQTSPFRRIKVHGQIAYADATRFFLTHDGAGLQIFPTGNADVSAGDLVEAVGYPYIGGITPLLSEALLRKTGAAALPPAKDLKESELAQDGLDSTRVMVQGRLLGLHIERGLPVLEMQSGTYLYFARLASANKGDLSWRTGCWLALTGVYVTQGKSFELLLNSPADIVVVSQPSWWTLQKLLIVVGIMVIILILALLWITQLRWLVEQRTAQLAVEIRKRELEAERSRIARDLHDDLGSSLTEISVLASAGQHGQTPDSPGSGTLFETIAAKVRHLITGLDVIVWAIDPGENSLQSLADYLCAYANEYLSSTAIACRFKVPVSFPPMTLDGHVRHELLLTIKETLNNIVRHADATEMEFRMAATATRLDITMVDNGRGIPDTVEHEGHGLKNLSARMKHLGGEYIVKSNIDQGTTVIVSLPLPSWGNGQGDEKYDK
jgi:signal transduction histidine kinase